jgi:hypothetical protein
MMAMLFALLTIAIGLAMAGRRVPSFGVFALTMAMSVYWYHHHATSALSIQL